MHLKKQPIAMCLFLAVQLGACASSSDETPVVLSQEVQGSLRNVGVMAVGSTPEPEALGPVSSVGDNVIGEGAEGVSDNRQDNPTAGQVLGGAACAFFIIACTAVVATATAVASVGAAEVDSPGVLIVGDAPVPPDTEAELRTVLSDALVNYDLRKELKDNTHTVFAARTDLQIIDLGIVDTPPSLDVADERNVIPPEIDSVLEIGLVQIALFQIEDEKTEYALLLNIHGRLTDLAMGESLWSSDRIVYVSAPAALAQWTGQGANRLRTEIDDGIRALSVEIGTNLFGPSG